MKNDCFHALSHWEREGTHAAGMGRVRADGLLTLTLPPLRGSLPLPEGEGK